MKREKLFGRVRQAIRILDDEYVPEERKREVSGEVLALLHQRVDDLVTGDSTTDQIIADVAKQSEKFLREKERRIDVARNLLNIYLSAERPKGERREVPLGVSVNHREKARLKRLFRSVLHDAADERSRRTVRGSRVRLEVAGSLAQGVSDYKAIPHTTLLKPSDWAASKVEHLAVDGGLRIPRDYQKHFSDVDLLLMSDVIFDTIDPQFTRNGWSMKLGEKYDVGLGGSPILMELHRRLIHQKIGGYLGRWINFVLLRDEDAYARYLQNLERLVERREREWDVRITPKRVLILDEVIK